MSKLEQARIAAGILSQTELARLLEEEEGVSIDSSLISHYESGRVTPPIKKARPIVNILQRRGVICSIDELFDQASTDEVSA